ncbi:hypothetical protein ACC796_36150, partial [Rhizobium ruizarguesonis]
MVQYETIARRIRRIGGENVAAHPEDRHLVMSDVTAQERSCGDGHAMADLLFRIFELFGQT